MRGVARCAPNFKRPPDLLGPWEIRSYQLHLATVRDLSPGKIAVAVAALQFLYCITLEIDWDLDLGRHHPKQPKKLPAIPSREEVATLFGSIPALSHGTTFSASYAAGLRIC